MLALACLALYCSPHEASDLPTVPDEVEYAAGATHLADGEGYFITVDGTRHPPRYGPWFSRLLAPAYRFRTRDRAGNGIVVVLAFALAGVLAASATAHRVSGTPGGILAATLVLAIPDYVIMSRHIMSDIPACALVLLAGLLFVRARERQPGLAAVLLTAGAVVALAISLRVLAIFTALPFLALAARSGSSARRRALLLALVATPTLLVALLTGDYNRRVFGSALRNGYQYWCSVPYDFPSLTWSAGYLWPNLKALLGSPTPLLAGLAVVLLLAVGKRPECPEQGRTALGRLLAFSALGVAPAAALHLVYFYQDTRFFLPAACILAVLCGALLGLPLSRAPQRLLWAPLLVLVVSLAAQRALLPGPPAARRSAAEAVLAATPPDAVIVASVDAAYLELMVGERSGRRIMALSRGTEYASKFVAPREPAPLQSPPAGWWDHRNPGLPATGAREAVERVAAENLGELERLLKLGRRVFVVAVAPTPADSEAIGRLAARFDTVALRPDLVELVTRGP